jgi:hypothetical protein
MALCASCGKRDDKNTTGAKITASVFLKAMSKMRSSAGGDGLEGKLCYSLVSDEFGKILLYQAAMCLMEEVFIFSVRSGCVNEVTGKIMIRNCCRTLGDEIVPNPSRL